MLTQGIWTALITPFHSSGEIDFDSFKKLLRVQKSSKVHGVIPCGTTGESPTLSIDERKELIRFTLKELRGSRVRVFAGTGSNDTKESVALSRWASAEGVDGVLIVTPYYNKPTQAGLEKHFRTIADSVRCEVMLYNVPGRTGVSLTPETIASLSKHPRIRSLKEATGNTALTSEIIQCVRNSKSSLQVLSGDDATFLPLMSVGACGVVSVTSNILPEKMVELYQAFQKKNLKKALAIHDQLFPAFKDLFIESNPGPVKFAAEWGGIGSRRLRLPLVSVSDGNQKN